MSNFLNQDFGSDDDEDDFNPAPQEESDVEEPRAKVGLPHSSILDGQGANR
jgi:transcription elongation factor SPT5